MNVDDFAEDSVVTDKIRDVFEQIEAIIFSYALYGIMLL